MICLTLDTAGSACAACLYDSADDRVLAEISEEIGKGHAERLMGIIHDVMAQAGISYKQIDRIVTTTGPGSFTGIRVGVATARGFGVGLSVPVIGISNLEAILHEFKSDLGSKSSDNTGVAITAGRGQAYCLFDFDTAFADTGEPFVADLDVITADLSNMNEPCTLCGSAAKTILDGADGAGNGLVPKKSYDKASISIVARLGARSPDNLKKPEPLYLRKPDAVPQKGFAVERVD